MLKLGILLGDDIGLEVVPECELVMKPHGKASTTQMGVAVAAAV